MFKFNFTPGSETAAPHAEAGAQEPEPSYDAPATEEMLDDQAHAGHSVPVEMLTIAPGLTLQKGVVSNAAAAAALGAAEVEQNDLIPGQYEGGFKQWEGGVDLAQYLAARAAQLLHGGHSPSSTGPAADGASSSCRVMELGCGHGLPGLVALHGGAEVHFQDYNAQVLRTLTMPNALANWRAWAPPAVGPCSAARPLPPSRARFFSGSWDSLAGLLEERGLGHSYDLVLTAETVYSLASAASLLACIKACLRRPDGGRPGGVALVAAKAYYFGCGGGVASFLKLVEQEGTFAAESVWALDDGRSNARSIIQLTFR